VTAAEADAALLNGHVSPFTPASVMPLAAEADAALLNGHSLRPGHALAGHAAEADAALLNGHTTQMSFLIGWDNRRVAARG
jgi:hypothetical protein